MLLVVLQSKVKNMLGLKYVAVQCLEQQPNLKEYFLKVPSETENTARYTRLKTCFADHIHCFCSTRFWGVFIAISKQGPCNLSSVSCNALSSLWSPRKIGLWCKIVFRGSWRKYQNNCQCWKECQTYLYDWCGNKCKNNAQKMISDEGQEKFR